MSTDFHTELQIAVEKRRNFAIISRPDAGKTTLTEKLLLFKNEWNLQQVQSDHPDLKLSAIAPLGSSL